MKFRWPKVFSLKVWLQRAAALKMIHSVEKLLFHILACLKWSFSFFNFLMCNSSIYFVPAGLSCAQEDCYDGWHGVPTEGHAQGGLVPSPWQNPLVWSWLWNKLHDLNAVDTGNFGLVCIHIWISTCSIDFTIILTFRVLLCYFWPQLCSQCNFFWILSFLDFMIREA